MKNSTITSPQTKTSQDLEPYISCKDHLVTGEQFDLLFDKDREMLITFPQPKEEELQKYYNSDEYISHTDSNKGLFNFLYQSVKNYSLHRKTKLATKLNKGKGLLLDVGAGTGDFLLQSKNAGWKVEGVEVNPSARNLSSAKGIHLKRNFSELDKNQFNIITLWHVLEHLPDLEAAIVKIENLLKPGGHLIIAVPNFNSYDAKVYKEFWAAYDVPRHLWHFSRMSIPKLFENLKLVKTKPMLFDSFYVSLLSEKYKTGSKFSIRAFWMGLLSNIKAWQTKEYSSVIYCLKKPHEPK